MKVLNVIRQIDGIMASARKLDFAIPLLARFVFGAILSVYFWASAITKLGDGMFGFLSPSAGAYVQIFPKVMEEVGYDTSALGVWHWAVVVSGTWAEFLLPLFLIIGFLTRLSALGMIGFICVQTLTDLWGHGLINSADSIGAWFDRAPDSLLMDQRLLWVFPLVVLFIKGGGAVSCDRIFGFGK